jgi:hypothetical protein
MMGWMHRVGSTTLVQALRITGFAIGTAVTYVDTDNTTVSTTVESDLFQIRISAENNEDEIRAALDTLTLTAALHSDENFELRLIVETTGGDEHLYVNPVAVLAVADPPSVTATDLVLVGFPWAQNETLYRPMPNLTISLFVIVD